MKIFDRTNLPPQEEFSAFIKRVPTFMVRIEGPFKVATLHGVVECDDGFLAIDAQGWPYPVAKEEFEAVYQPIGSYSDDTSTA